MKKVSWIHGADVQLEDSSWKALPQAFSTTVRPEKKLSGWIHIAIPTPVWLEGAKLKAQTAHVQVATGAARISTIHVRDGELKILDIDSNITGPAKVPISFEIPGTPAISVGTVISMLVDFVNGGPDAWVQVIGGGIDFV